MRGNAHKIDAASLREQVEQLLPGWKQWYPNLFDAASDLGLIRARVCPPGSLLSEPPARGRAARGRGGPPREVGRRTRGAAREMTVPQSRPPLPPFTEETAKIKVKAAEDAWNTRDPERVAGAYTEDSVWRNRDEFIRGRAEIVHFLQRKWARELDYRLRKSLWAFTDRRIAVRFQYEWHDGAGHWHRSYGNELWEFADNGLMRRREASINDVEDRRGRAALREPDLGDRRATAALSRS